MDLSQAKDLLAKAQKHCQPKRAKSIFDVGGRGYYENPTTDMLAFFLEPEQEHGLGNCFLRALLDCIEGQHHLPALSQPPQREVSTAGGKRMDLILHGEGWGLLLENKVFHSQDNPFSGYEQYFDKLCSENNWQPMYVLLSPSGQSNPGRWTGLKYETLIKAVREQLAGCQSQPMNKWRVLADEFLLHLENLTVEHEMNRDAFNFVFENLPQIKELEKLRTQALDALDAKIIASLKAEIKGYRPYQRRHTWPDGVALRYACDDWSTWSDVVLYLDGQTGHLQPTVRVYLCEMDASLKRQGCDLFGSSFPAKEPWEEVNGSVLGFEWQLDEFEERTVKHAVVEKMKMLMRFEKLRLQQSTK